MDTPIRKKIQEELKRMQENSAVKLLKDGDIEPLEDVIVKRGRKKREKIIQSQAQEETRAENTQAKTETRDSVASVKIEENPNGHEEELPESLNLQEQSEYKTPAEADSEGYKSEIVKQLFDIPDNKVLERTELPRRMILPMSMMDTAIFLTKGYKVGRLTGPEYWMIKYGRYMLSAGRKIRLEGMAAFQPTEQGEGGNARIDM
jgi:hypothetical protein